METATADKRQYERKAYGAYVNLTVDRLTYKVLLKDLSLGGAFIAGDHLPPIGDETNVSLAIPYEDKPGAVELKGTIRRVTDSGVGIEFF